MPTLIEHAERELAIIGETEGFVHDNIVAVVKAFAEGGHSGESAIHTIDILERLLRRLPLTPITNDPAEWEKVKYPETTQKMWQNVRDSRAISYNRGRTYYLVDEGEGIMHFSEKA